MIFFNNCGLSPIHVTKKDKLVFWMQTIIAEIEWKVVVVVFIATHLLNLIEPAVSFSSALCRNERTFISVHFNYLQSTNCLSPGLQEPMSGIFDLNEWVGHQLKIAHSTTEWICMVSCAGRREVRLGNEV